MHEQLCSPQDSATGQTELTQISTPTPPKMAFGTSRVIEQLGVTAACSYFSSYFVRDNKEEEKEEEYDDDEEQEIWQCCKLQLSSHSKVPPKFLTHIQQTRN